MAVRRLHRGRGSDPNHRHRHLRMPAGGFFLLHHVDVVMEEQPVQAIELIGGYDPTADSFTGRATTIRAISRSCVPGLTSGRVDLHRWRRDIAAVVRSLHRRRGRNCPVQADGQPRLGHHSAKWERCEDDATWQPWMDMTFHPDAMTEGRARQCRAVSVWTQPAVAAGHRRRATLPAQSW
jgi:hypothetical protein